MRAWGTALPCSFLLPLYFPSASVASAWIPAFLKLSAPTWTASAGSGPTAADAAATSTPTASAPAISADRLPLPPLLPPPPLPPPPGLPGTPVQSSRREETVRSSFPFRSAITIHRTSPLVRFDQLHWGPQRSNQRLRDTGNTGVNGVNSGSPRSTGSSSSWQTIGSVSVDTLPGISTHPASSKTCQDSDPGCSGWTSFCSSDDYTRKNCALTCGLCSYSGSSRELLPPPKAAGKRLLTSRISASVANTETVLFRPLPDRLPAPLLPRLPPRRLSATTAPIPSANSTHNSSVPSDVLPSRSVLLPSCCLIPLGGRV